MTAQPPPQRPAGVDDAGVTLIETVVVLTILAIIMTMVTSGMVGMTRNYRAGLAYTEAQTQVGRAYRRIDAELRYAGELAVNPDPTDPAPSPDPLRDVDLPPGLPEPSLVWIAATYPVGGPDSYTATVKCYALSLSDGDLQLREWAPGEDLAGASLINLARGVGRVPGEEPFQVTGGKSSNDDDTESADTAQRAHLAVQVTAGGSADSASRVLMQTFAAPNTLNSAYQVQTCF